MIACSIHMLLLMELVFLVTDLSVVQRNTFLGVVVGFLYFFFLLEQNPEQVASTTGGIQETLVQKQS